MSRELATLRATFFRLKRGRNMRWTGPIAAATMSPGQSGSITLEVSADSAGGALTLDLSPGDLRSRSGAIIPANKIKVRPDHLAIAPGSNGRFVVDILVPLQSKPAIYTGRVIGSGPEPVSFQIEVEVGPPKA